MITEKIMKEVMVGDWVMFDTNYSEDEPMYSGERYECHRITRGEEIDLACERTVLGNDVFQPIPITEDILTKNGFKRTYDNIDGYKFYNSEDGRICVSDLTNMGDDYWNVHIDNEDFSTIGSCDVKYVHQFQQLLRLCGYDMDVVV